jgi:hypothetical protein
MQSLDLVIEVVRRVVEATRNLASWVTPAHGTFSRVPVAP